MKNIKLENLVKDIYNVWIQTNMKKTYSVFLYGKNYIHSISIITDINYYLSCNFIDSLLIQSKNEKLLIHGWDIDSYNIEENCLNIRLKNDEIKKIYLYE